MKAIWVATASLAVLSAPSLAQTASAPGANTCYIEISRLMAGQSGIAELRAAVGLVNERLRPQADEVNRLKKVVDGLELQQQQAMQNVQSANDDSAGTPNGEITRINEDLRKANTELNEKQTQLKADYDAQMTALVGPIQQRVSARALAFGAQHHCANLKLAHAPDVAALRSSGAQDLTLDFVSAYKP